MVGAVAKPHELHRKAGPKSVRVGIVTVSDSRTEQTDESGEVIRRKLVDAGNTVPFYRVVKDDPKAIAAAVEEALRASDAVITDGGTGLGKRDVTIATLDPTFERRLPGFGELFRALSYKDVGAAAMLSGATAGVLRGKLVFCLPGSPAACRLAMDMLILPELAHAIGVMRR